MADLEKLERLNRLRESGALSADEYEQEKAKVLAGQPANAKPLIIVAVIAIAIVLLAVFSFTAQGDREVSNSLALTAPPEPLASPTTTVAPSPSETLAPQQRIDPPIPQTAAPDPTNAEYYNEAKQDAMSAHSDQPAGIREMLGDWAGANTLCRGSSDEATVNKWCPVRDRLSERLEKMGLCYGRPTDQSAAESDWHTCDARDRASAN